MVCFICLKEKQDIFDIFKEDKDDLHVADTIKKHLWFLEDQLKTKSNKSRICNECWVVIKNFDRYFKQIQEVHQLSKHSPEFDDKCFQNEDLLPEKIKVEPTQFDNNSDDDTNNDFFTKQEEDIDSNTEIKNPKPHRKKIDKKKKDQETPKVPKAEKRTNAQMMAHREESETMVFEFCKPTCEICSFQFTSFRSLKLHYTKEHKMKGFIRCCHRKYYDFCRIAVHVQVHQNPSMFRCDICQRTYGSDESLSRHKKSHNQKTLQCSYAGCEKLYPSNRHLRIHVKRVHETKLEEVTCDVCNKVFQDKLKFKNHFVSVHNTEKFVCDQCGRTCNTKGNLKEHRKTHFETGKRMQCPICLHWLKNPNYFKYHMRIHEESDKEYICSYCSKKCKNSRYLKSHVRRVHLSEWSLQCSYCDRKFNRQINLREHIAALHTGEALYTCNFCDKTFNSSANMAVHRKRAHPVEWELHIKPKFMKPSTSD